MARRKTKLSKEKLDFLTYILIFCVTITALGGYFLGTHFGNDNISASIAKDEFVKEDNDNVKFVKENVNGLFEILNKDYNQYVSKYLNKNVNKENIELLDYIAPFAMEAIYDIEYTEKDNYKYMTLDDYKLLQEYFNVYLNEEENKKYIAYELENNILEINKINFKIADIEQKSNYYKIDVDVYKNDVLLTKCLLTATIKDNHIYYVSFVINE